MDVCIARIFEEEKEGSHGQRIQRLPKTRAKDLNDPKKTHKTGRPPPAARPAKKCPADGPPPDF